MSAAAAAWGRRVTYGGRGVAGAGGQPGGGGRALAVDGGGAALALAQVPLALADQCLLVALHPLQLLLGGHPAPGLAAAAGGLRGLRGRRQALQGTLRSLLLRQGGRRETGIGATSGWR